MAFGNYGYHYPFGFPPKINPYNFLNEPQTQEDSNYKPDVIKWLKDSTLRELQQIFTIHDQEYTFPILKMFINDQSLPQMYSQKKETVIKKIPLDSKIEEYFIMKSYQDTKLDLFQKLLVFDSDLFFDTIQVKESELANIDQFLKFLDDITDRKIFYYKPKDGQDPSWFNIQTPQPAINWVIREFEHNVSRNFQNRKKLKQQRFYEPQIIDSAILEFINITYINHKDKLYNIANTISQILQEKDSLIKVFYNLVSNRYQHDLIQGFVQKSQIQHDVLNQKFQYEFYEILDYRTYYWKLFIREAQVQHQKSVVQELIEQEENNKKNKVKKQKRKKKLNKLDKNDQIKSCDEQLKFSVHTIDWNELKNKLNEGMNNYKRKPSQDPLDNDSLPTTPPNTPKHNIDIEMIEIKPKDKLCSIEPLFSDIQDSVIVQTIKMISKSQQNQNQQDQQLDYVLKQQQSYLKVKKLYDEDFQTQSPPSELTRCSSEIQNHNIKSCQSLENTRSVSVDEQDPCCFINSQILQKSQGEHTQMEQKQTSNKKKKLTKKSNNKQSSDQKPQPEKQSIQQKVEQIIQEFTVIDTIEKAPEYIEMQVFSSNIKEEPEEQEIEIIQESTNVSEQFDISGFQELAQQKFIQKLHKESKMINYQCLDSWLSKESDSLIKSVFMGTLVDIRLFGSCATGLALIDSDIDICVLGFEQLQKAYVINSQRMLFDAIQRCKWIVNSKCISETTIPIIKLEINPEIPYLESGCLILNKQEHVQWQQIKNKLKINLKVDITFNKRSDHMGDSTTELIRDWMSLYPNFQGLVLILKSIIRKLNIAETFKGGLSSYAITIMVYCFLKEKKFQDLSLGYQLYEMIKFYSQEFNPKIHGMGIYHQDRDSLIFNLEDYPLPQIQLCIFSPLNQRLLTSHSVHVGKLFDFLQKIYQQSLANIEKNMSYFQMGKKKRIKYDKEQGNFIDYILN
ncbi:hypothetical protein pb186bvf_013871 [Paramecium bursaria]